MADPLAWRGDWLNFWLNSQRYYIGDQDATDAACTEYKSKGYTDVLVGTVWPEDDPELPFYNFVRNPAAWVARAQGFTSRGLRVILGFSFEGAPDVWAGHELTFLDELQAFLDVAVPAGVVSSIAIMPEPFELWSPDYVLDMVQIIGTYGKDFGIHDGESAWGPTGEEVAFWNAVKAAAPTVKRACIAQYEHGTSRANGGFLSPESEVIGATSFTEMLLTATRLPATDTLLIAGEYAWNGMVKTSVVVKESDGRALGAKALQVQIQGRRPIGAINGCELSSAVTVPGGSTAPSGGAGTVPDPDAVFIGEPQGRILRSMETFDVVSAPEIEVPLVIEIFPAFFTGKGYGRIVHPTLGAFDYEVKPDEWVNIDQDAIISPLWATTQTITSAANVLWDGYIKDVVVEERWKALGGIAMPITQLRMLLAVWTTPIDPDVGYVHWYPNYVTQQGYKVLPLNVSAGGEGIAFDDVVNYKDEFGEPIGWITAPVTFQLKLVERL